MRRRAALLGLLGAVVAVCFAAQSPAAAAARRTLNVLGWADEIDPAILDAFTAETGIVVTYDGYDRADAAPARLAAGHGAYDLAIVPTDLVAGLAERKAIRGFDRSRLRNPPAPAPELGDRLRSLDPAGLSAPYLWGTIGIGFSPDAVRQRLGDRPVEGWDVVFRPDTAARLKDCGILLPDRPAEVFPSVLRVLGLPPDSRNAGDYQRAADLLMRVRPSVRRFGSGDAAPALVSGDACLAVGTSAEMLRARANARDGDSGSGTAVDYVVPKEGAPLWADVIVLAADAHDPEAAHAFLDFVSRPENAARNAAALGIASAVAGTRALMPATRRDDPALFPRDDLLRRTFVVPAPDPKLQAVIDRLWARLKAGK